MSDVSFDCEVVIHPVPKGLTAHKMQKALRATVEVPPSATGSSVTEKRPRFSDIEGVPSLSMKDGMTIAFALRPHSMTTGDIGNVVLRALTIVRSAAEAEGVFELRVAFVSVELFD